VLLIAPGTWAVQTLGHATSGTFPAGGPANAISDFGGGGPGGGRFPGGPGAAMRGGGFPQGGRTAPGGPPPGFAPGGQGGAGGPSARGGFGGGAGGPSARGGFGGGGGLFGGNAQALTQALAYAKAHGGGTVAVSSQTGAAAAIISSGANVVGIGGFSGRESQVSVSWLADAVASGKIRYVVGDGAGGFGGRGLPGDSRVGAKAVMSVVTQVGRKVTGVSGLYDLQGLAAALRAKA
jgi:hypothetical protein